MKMPPFKNLWDDLATRENSSSYLCGPRAAVAWGALARGSVLCGRREELKDRSVLVATDCQLAAALAMVDLDGLARRIVLCPPGLSAELLRRVRKTAEADAIVSDRPTLELGTAEDTGEDAGVIIPCSSELLAYDSDRGDLRLTEWVLLTSGTTGTPKLAVHTLASLAGGIEVNPSSDSVVWATFYDIRRYGGLQIFLRAIRTGASLVLPGCGEATADFLARAGAHQVTHISGTPSHWRRVLMSPAAGSIAPRYIRLSGEIADQAVLDSLRSMYPDARIAHAFASTEAGLAFEVNDGRAGFPASYIARNGDVAMKIQHDSLCIRSSRTALRYLGQDRQLRDADGFVDTGDVLELRANRYYFAGRRDGMINVGGLKVHPEEVEGVINQHPAVKMSRVRTRKSPITGSLVVADVVPANEPVATTGRPSELQQDILQFCQQMLPRHKVPAAINFVAALTVDATGKLARHDA